MDVLCKKKGIEPAEHWNRQRLDKLRLDATWTARSSAGKLRKALQTGVHRPVSSMQELAVSGALGWLHLEERCD